MKTVSESIFDGDRYIIPMADVSYIEKERKGEIVIHLKYTTFDDAQKHFNNTIWLDKKESESFLKAWCMYRHELEINTLKNISINNVSNEIGKNIVKNLKNNSKLT